MRRKVLYVLSIIILILCIEILMRMYFGFCDTVLMQEDADFEYIAQPNQNRFRFRNHLNYNSHSMRSDEVDTTATIILGFGDSVLNGGVQTDQNELATEILSDSLSKLHGKKVQFLNISAGSWGPDNCYGYLKRFGDFGAESIILFVSSHDAYDNMNFEKIVDVHPSFPSRQYSSAIYELIDRYIYPRVMKWLFGSSSESAALGINKKVNDSKFNNGFQSFLAFSRGNNIPFTVYLHADKDELRLGDYNMQGKEIIKFTLDNKIPIILDLSNGLELSHFRDGIHLNDKGQQNLANTISRYLIK